MDAVNCIFFNSYSCSELLDERFGVLPLFTISLALGVNV